MDLCWQSNVLFFNMLSRLVITFLPRTKRLLISWLQSPSAEILEPGKIKSAIVSTVSPSITHEVMGPDAMIFVFWMCSPFTTRPVFPALGPLQALREEVLWCLAMVHLCVTTKTSGEPLSERSLCLKFGQPSWSSLFLLPSVDFSTCHFLPVVITSYYLGYSFPSQLFSRPVLSDSATPWTAACQASLSLTPPSERCSSQYL